MQYYSNAEEYINSVKSTVESDRKELENRRNESLHLELAAAQDLRDKEDEDLRAAQEEQGKYSAKIYPPGFSVDGSTALDIDAARQQAVSDSLDMYRALQKQRRW